MIGKYLKPCSYEFIDVYRVCKIFNVTDPGIQHALKKLLFAGERGYKDMRQDLMEALEAIERSITMLEEEQQQNEE